jgi:hypothetical protein
MRWWSLTIVILSLAFAPLLGRGRPQEGQPRNEPAGTKVAFEKDIVPFFAKYCTACHGGKKPKADLSLEKFKDEKTAAEHRPLWEKVAQHLRSGEMPPEGRKKPQPAEIERITAWIDTAMSRVDCTKERDPGRVTIRRLNKAEYKNTIRDLLGVTFKPADDFPSDDVGYGFDNIGDVLTMSPLLLERYLDAAEKIVEEAFNDADSKARLLKKPEGKVRRMEAARFMLEKFVSRAYRRPATADEVARLARFVELAEQNGQTFEKGIQLALQATLVSPHFLFRVELDQQSDKGVYLINEWELASRLSYFLWSSMPDEELSRLAAAKKLREGDTLELQVRRMLKDPKAQALTENFAGQWLQLRNLKTATPDPGQFPRFDEDLRSAMLRETELFFETIIKEDRSILDFLDADFTFVNERLAKHYGVPGIKGKEFQRVRVNADQRGGVLTQASILTLTSNPTRTSPVKRGKYILENILNTPPPPPPPDAGELEEGAGEELKGTLRQRMEMHRSKPLCASCHQRMDPLGFAFENFDGIGAWRGKEGKFAIDATGTLPTGQTFNGPKELRAILRTTKAADFRRCLTEKMLTYALGRGLEYYDRCAVDDISVALARGQDRFSSLMIAIAKSDPFQKRKAKGGMK